MRAARVPKLTPRQRALLDQFTRDLVELDQLADEGGCIELRGRRISRLGWVGFCLTEAARRAGNLSAHYNWTPLPPGSIDHFECACSERFPGTESGYADLFAHREATGHMKVAAVGRSGRVLARDRVVWSEMAMRPALRD